MAERRWRLALLSSHPPAAERLSDACEADEHLQFVHIDDVDEAVAGLEAGTFDVVAATYPPRGKWVDGLRECANHGLCVWVAGTTDVSSTLQSAFTVEETDAIYAQAVIDYEDISANGIHRACLSAEYVKRLQDRLRASVNAAEDAAEESRLATFVIEHSNIVVFRWLPSAGSPVVYVTDNVRIFGYAPEDMRRGDFLYQTILHPEDLELNLRRIKEYREAGIDRFVLTYRLLTRDGEERWVEDSTRVVRDDSDAVIFHEGIVQDVTQRRAAQDQLVRLSQAVEQSPSSVVIADTRGRIEYINQAFTDISGYEWDEVVSQRLVGFNADGESEESRSLWKSIWHGTEWRGEMRKRRRDGAAYWEAVRGSPVRGAQGRITHYLEVGEDITLRKKNEEIIRQMAYYDALTGLPNRTLFYDRLDVAMAQARRDGSALGVLFLDLDEFKAVNDTHGHAAGDELLENVARLLRSCVREGDTVARMGGDEFMVLSPGLDAAESGGTVAQKIIAVFRDPIVLETGPVLTTTSVGVATFPLDGEDAESLIKAADRAMYEAKQAGRNGFAYATGTARETSVRRVALGDLLQQALVRGDFHLRFQPIIDLRTGRVVAAEGLLRWDHPGRGLLPPAEFLALADAAGLLPAIDAWVFETACEAWASLRNDGHLDVRVAVNISPRQLSSKTFPDHVREAVESAGIPHGRIELEFDAAAVAADVATAKETLGRLRAGGVRLAIGAVGTSEWSFLRTPDLPVDLLKLERELVRTLPDKKVEAAIARAITEFARGVGVDVVAQGVEGGPQLEFVREIGCHLVQGFAYALPMGLNELAEFVTEHNRAASSYNTGPRRAIKAKPDRAPVNTNSAKLQRVSADWSRSVTEAIKKVPPDDAD